MLQAVFLEHCFSFFFIQEQDPGASVRSCAQQTLQKGSPFMQRFFWQRVQPLRQLAAGNALSSQLEAEREKTRAAQELLAQREQDFADYRRRAEKRQDTARAAGRQEACLALIATIENMDRVLQTIPEFLDENPWL